MKEEWKKVKLGEISADIQTGPFGSQLHMSDYSEKGMYFITICTKNRECILSKIKCGSVKTDPYIELNDILFHLVISYTLDEVMLENVFMFQKRNLVGYVVQGVCVSI